MRTGICLRILLFSLMFLPFFVFSQFTDNFGDGDFANNPAWSGSDTSFVINSGVLQSNGSQLASNIYLSTPNTLIDSVEWNFLIRLDFNPSTANYARVYLVSDGADVTTNFGARYFVQFGETGNSDTIQIYAQFGTFLQNIFTGTNACMLSTNSNLVRVKILRHIGGLWDVFTDCTGGTNFNPEGSFSDNSITSTAYFGVLCSYTTASRYNQFYFDDFSVSYIQPDTTKPSVVSVNVVSATALDVKFSEPVDTVTSLSIGNYIINSGIGPPQSVSIDGTDKTLIHLALISSLISGNNYQITVSNIKDLAGNTMNSTTIHFAFFTVSGYDILINEIFADPDPQVGLPRTEYVELYNRAANPVSLNGWTFSDAATTATLPGVSIPADSFLILCPLDSAALFQSFGMVQGLNPFPSLNNTGDSLTLHDNQGNLIQRVQYNATWYHDSNKSAGGWSLEMVDPNNPCSGKDNWRASVDPSGGTPGRANSVIAVNPDTIFPSLVRVAILDSFNLILYFSESMDSGNVSIPGNYMVNNGVGSPVLISANSDYTTVQLRFSQNFARGIIYTITVSNLSDCSGNPVGMNDSALFAVPDTVLPNDLIINEILFNPKTGGYDFVELYNRSQKVIDLSQLDILEKDITDPTVILEQAGVSANSFLVFPEQFIVLTDNPDYILQNYFVETPSALLHVPSMPNYADDKSICLLRVHNGATIDSLAYDHNWHFPLLTIEDGVSLERVDYNKPTQDKNNWHSAASTVGFATPTYRNSQFSETGITENQVSVDPEVFTPDNDGEKDFTFVNYKFSEPGYTMNIRIYDAKGREVKNLVRNELLASEGKFQWDGTDDENQKARIGIYIVYAEVFNLQGKTKLFKKQVVLGANLK